MFPDREKEIAAAINIISRAKDLTGISRFALDPYIAYAIWYKN